MRNDLLRDQLPGYPNFNGGERFFLFDEGQSSYWDTSLWSVLRDEIQDTHKPVYAILFSRYGNEQGSNPAVPRPLDFAASVTLNRVDEGGSQSCRLLLDKEEFCDVIRRQAPKLYLTVDLRNFIYQLTKGHIGYTVAVMSFLLEKVCLYDDQAT